MMFDFLNNCADEKIFCSISVDSTQRSFEIDVYVFVFTQYIYNIFSREGGRFGGLLLSVILFSVFLIVTDESFK